VLGGSNQDHQASKMVDEILREDDEVITSEAINPYN
jgi:hypothetical protein